MVVPAAMFILQLHWVYAHTMGVITFTVDAHTSGVAFINGTAFRELSFMQGVGIFALPVTQGGWYSISISISIHEDDDGGNTVTDAAWTPGVWVTDSLTTQPCIPDVRTWFQHHTGVVQYLRRPCNGRVQVDGTQVNGCQGRFVTQPGHHTASWTSCSGQRGTVGNGFASGRQFAVWWKMMVNEEEEEEDHTISTTNEDVAMQLGVSSFSTTPSPLLLLDGVTTH